MEVLKIVSFINYLKSEVHFIEKRGGYNIIYQQYYGLQRIRFSGRSIHRVIRNLKLVEITHASLFEPQD